jgi:UDP-N-acetylmuramoylalanine--D-glutamate ligase
VILIGETADRIHKSLKAAKYKGGIKTAESMEQIVQIAKDKTLAPSPQSLVPIVLLSTASPSYDMFKNFEEKGDQFAACIRALE